MEKKVKLSCKEQKNIDKKKILLLSIGIMILILVIIFFIKNNYKNQKSGNNMSNKNIEEIEAYILNISSYQAKIEVTVENNKNTNKYVIEQVYQKDKMMKQTILEPSNIEGLEILYENGTLKINHSKLNLTTIYENYDYIAENFLWLDAFIEDYKNSNEKSIKEENNHIIMQTKTRNENHRYVCEKMLYIDKNTGKPTKLLIEDINKKDIVYILYNEIAINDLQ